MGGECAEADLVAGLELADFPELSLHNGGGTDEAAAARAVGAEDDRHVAGEIDRADGIGVVVEIGGMQAGLAAVAARPLRLRPDETDAGARGIVVNLVGRAEEDGDVGRREKIWRAVGTIENADVPLAVERREEGAGQTRQGSSWSFVFGL